MRSNSLSVFAGLILVIAMTSCNQMSFGQKINDQAVIETSTLNPISLSLFGPSDIKVNLNHLHAWNKNYYDTQEKTCKPHYGTHRLWVFAESADSSKLYINSYSNLPLLAWVDSTRVAAEVGNLTIFEITISTPLDSSIAGSRPSTGTATIVASVSDSSGNNKNLFIPFTTRPDPTPPSAESFIARFCNAAPLP